MKIKDNVERECCALCDLVQYNGDIDDSLKGCDISFCKHCGQLFIIKDGNGSGAELSIKKIIVGKSSNI